MIETEGFELLPADDESVPVPDDVESAAAAALDATTPTPVEREAPEPYGRTWLFDFEKRRLVRRGQGPQEVRDLDALRVWILTIAHTERFANAIFSDQIGMERPYDIIGQTQVQEAAADYEQRFRESLLVHDRIAGIDDFDVTYYPDTGVIEILNFSVRTDDDARLHFGTLRLAPEA